jgi:hypothetical protein
MDGEDRARLAAGDGDHVAAHIGVVRRFEEASIENPICAPREHAEHHNNGNDTKRALARAIAGRSRRKRIAHGLFS